MGLTITGIRAIAASSHPAGPRVAAPRCPRLPRLPRLLDLSAPLAGGGLVSPPAGFLELARVTRLDVRLLSQRDPPFCGGAATLELGVELGAEQDRDVGDPQPDQEDDHAGDGAV